MAIPNIFIDLMYIFDINISSNTRIHVSLLDYLSVYYMISCYYILVQSRTNDLCGRRYLIEQCTSLFVHEYVILKQSILLFKLESIIRG